MLAKVSASISSYGKTLIRKKRLTLIVFFIVFLSIALYGYIQPPVYRADCSIKVIESQSIADLITLKPPSVSYNRMSLVARALVNKAILEKVIYDLGLVNEKTPTEDIENTILAIRGVVKADSEPVTDILQISVDYTNADMAAKIANGIAQVYIERDVTKKKERAKNYRVLIEEQLVKAKEELTETENSLNIFKEQNEQVSGVAIAIQNNIATLEKQKAEFLQSYNSEYPDIVKINEQVEELKKELQILPPEEVEFTNLQRGYEEKAEACRILQSKLEDARIAEKEISPGITIVKPAAAPARPISPNKNIVVIFSLIAGIILFLIIVLIVRVLKVSRPKTPF